MADPADLNMISSADSIRDPLTGAYSRALLQERYGEEIDRARRYGVPCSLCLFDVDYFKSVNDAYGHTRGDLVLRELVQRLLGIIRSSDLLFRYGGDEFILLLPNTPKAEAVTLANRILHDIQTTPFPGSPALTLSLSIGVAGFPDDAQTSELLFEAADRRNYAAKRRGRGCVVGDERVTPQPLLGDGLSRLIERDAAIDQLYHFLEQLPAQGRGTLAVIGRPGAGRTRFLTKVAEAARLRGYTVIALAGSAATQHQPYGALGEQRSAVMQCADVAQVAAALLERARDHTGLLLTVDDAQLIDRATLGLLRHLLSRAEQTTAVVAGYELDRPRRPLHTGQALDAQIELQPLSLNGLRIWLRSLLHWEAPATFLSWLHQQTDGLPAAIQRSLAYLIQQDVLHSIAEREWVLRPNYATITLAERIALHASAPPHNLPQPLTDFIGREQEIRQVIGLLERRRLVTLLGPGGIGKTQLALQVARGLLPDFAQGVFFVPLAAISDPELVASAIATTFAIKEVSGQPLLDSLSDYLHDKELLLLLDNFEQIVAAAPLVSRLLSAAPGLKVLATSRELLRVSGEQVFRLPPLALPDISHADRPLSPEALADYAAVALFAARAQAVRDDWTLTAANAPIVAELCARLDGLPLAIELAAARSNLFSPAEILSHLSSRLTLLTSGPRDVPARQQTLRGAIDWSYALLTPSEQRLFIRLAIFADSCRLAAVTAICADQDAPVRLDDLIALIDKSLLLSEETQHDEPRFRMLETIREYALEQLTASGELEQLRERHAGYYLQFVEQAEPHLSAGDQQDWLLQLEDEHYNLQAAIDWATQSGALTLAARLSGAIWRFWVMRSHLSTGRRVFDALLPQLDAVPEHPRARVLLGSGTLAWLQGDYAEALAPLEQSVALFQLADDRAALATALNNLGLVTREQGDYERAQACFLQSLALRQQLGDQRGVAFTLGNLGRVAFYQGAIDKASAWNEESLALFRALDDPWGIAVALYDLAEVVLYQQHERATVLFHETLHLSQQLGDKMLTGYALGGLGEIALEQGDLVTARQHFSAALTLQRATGDKEGGVTTIERLAALALAEGAAERAARLLGAVEVLRERLGAPVPPVYQSWYQQLLAAVSARLGPTAQTRIHAAGRALSVEQAISEALRPTSAPESPAPDRLGPSDADSTSDS